VSFPAIEWGTPLRRLRKSEQECVAALPPCERGVVCAALATIHGMKISLGKAEYKPRGEGFTYTPRRFVRMTVAWPDMPVYGDPHRGTAIHALRACYPNHYFSLSGRTAMELVIRRWVIDAPFDETEALEGRLRTHKVNDTESVVHVPCGRKLDDEDLPFEPDPGVITESRWHACSHAPRIVLVHAFEDWLGVLTTPPTQPTPGE
jgi:hypothetical protein